MLRLSLFTCIFKIAKSRGLVRQIMRQIVKKASSVGATGNLVDAVFLSRKFAEAKNTNFHKRDG